MRFCVSRQIAGDAKAGAQGLHRKAPWSRIPSLTSHGHWFAEFSALPLKIESKSLNLSEPQFPSMRNEGIKYDSL